MLAFGAAIRDEKAVGDTGLERLCVRARHFGFHAANSLTVKEGFGYGNGVGVGDEMPERQAIFIGLPFVQRDDFDFREFVWPFQYESDRDCRGISGDVAAVADYAAGVSDVNGLWLEPVREIKYINTGKHECGENEDQVSFSHKIFECAGA